MKRFGVLLASLATVALLMPREGTAVDPAVAACRAMPVAAERLACYDRAVDAAQPVSADSGTPIIDQRVDSGTPIIDGATQSVTAAAASVEAPGDMGDSGTPIIDRDTGTADTAGASAASESGGTTQAIVDRVSLDSARKQIVYLSNNEVWAQTDATNLRVRAGDIVVIEPGSLGSYFLRKEGSTRKMRVKKR